MEDDALVEALATGRVGAAGLDVFRGEPAIDPRYFKLPNVFMSPHIGSSTTAARRRMGLSVRDSLSRWWAAQT